MVAQVVPGGQTSGPSVHGISQLQDSPTSQPAKPQNFTGVSPGGHLSSTHGVPSSSRSTPPLPPVPAEPPLPPVPGEPPLPDVPTLPPELPALPPAPPDPDFPPVADPELPPELVEPEEPPLPPFPGPESESPHAELVPTASANAPSAKKRAPARRRLRSVEAGRGMRQV
jgi:hypothetical protein